MKNYTLLPAIRSHVGDWIYYVTTLTFSEVRDLIKDPDEIHERKGLSSWIQRTAIDKHSNEISDYIRENKQRFLGSLIIGVYDGSPDWRPLKVKFPDDYKEISQEKINGVEGKLGLLQLNGEEKLFAIDGQHRVAGIKKALNQPEFDSEIKEDNVSAIFVAHDATSQEGKERTRRLFTTVNKKAKRISTSAKIALDEDNGFAITTRKLIDSHWLFEDSRKHISYSSGGAIPAKDEKSITSVVGLYEIIKLLYPNKGRNKFDAERPSDQDLESYLAICMEFFDLLIEKVPAYKSVFTEGSQNANDYRDGENNHLLFRPVGQKAFAGATELLISRGNTLEEAINILLNANMLITKDEWHHIVWNPIDNKMIANKLHLAETQLLRLAGQQARNVKLEDNLNKLLASIEASK